MKQLFTKVEGIHFDVESILEYCKRLDKTNGWDDVYPGVPVQSKRGPIELMSTTAKQILDDFNPELGLTYENIQLLKLRPGETGITHRDTDRLCTMIFPLTPRDETYSPVVFYTDEGEEIAREYYGDGAIILNVLEPHGVAKTDVERVNLQIDFHISYDEVRTHFENGTLFK